MSTCPEFISKFAHDVRNPLAGIKGQADLLELKLSDKPDLLRKVNQINCAAVAIEKIIEELQNYNIGIQSEEFELIDLIQNVLKQAGNLPIMIETVESQIFVQYQKDLISRMLLFALYQQSGPVRILLENVQKNVMIQTIGSSGEILLQIQIKRGRQ